MMPMIQEIPQAPQVKCPKFQLGYGDYLRFRHLVLERSGLHFPEKKRADLEIGLLKALAESPLVPTNGHYNLDDYYNLLCDKSDPTSRAELDRLINTLTVGETYFFRDEAQFSALANHVLPALITGKRAAAAAVGPDIQPQLRIWSAGCATGEEPYSLAILLKELLPDIDHWHILILATDISQDALVRAREALYSDWSFREPRAKALRPRYFTRTPARNTRSAGARLPQTTGRYRLHDDIRQMVTFASLNLIEDDYPTILNNTVSLDLILCRNVTIYFTAETTRQVVNRFYEALVDGGWLVVGHAEPSLVIYEAFQAQTFPNALLYQKQCRPVGETGRSTSWPGQWEESTTGRGQKSGAVLESSPATVFLPQNGKRLMAHENRLVISPNGSPPAPESVPSNFASSPPSDVDPYQLAEELLHQGYVKEAIHELERKVVTTPEFAPAYSLLGRAYANLGHWAEARRWCQSALELDGLLAEAYYVLALVHQHEDQIEPAIEMLKKAIYLQRSAPLFHFNLAMLYKKSAQTKNAQRTIRNAIRILEKWPPEKIVPDSGGATAKHLLETARWVASKLEIEIRN